MIGEPTDSRSNQGTTLRPAMWALAVVSAVCFGAWLALAEAGPGTAARGGKAKSEAAGASREASCRILYLGFVGALEPPENKSSGVVQIRDTLRGPEYPEVCAKSYSPYTWTEGRDWLLGHFPAHKGNLTAEEQEQAPKVVLVGHSMGGWAMVKVARELRGRGIPVELAIQVDSVGLTDSVVPRNVKAAAVFYARDLLMLLTTKKVQLEDPSQTKLLANVRVEGAGHESVTRDPRIRQMVLQTVEELRMSGKSARASE